MKEPVFRSDIWNDCFKPSLEKVQTLSAPCKLELKEHSYSKILTRYNQIRDDVLSGFKGANGLIDRHKIATGITIAILSEYPLISVKDCPCESASQNRNLAYTLSNEILAFDTAIAVVMQMRVAWLQKNGISAKADLWIKHGWRFHQVNHGISFWVNHLRTMQKMAQSGDYGYHGNMSESYFILEQSCELIHTDL